MLSDDYYELGGDDQSNSMHHKFINNAAGYNSVAQPQVVSNNFAYRKKPKSSYGAAYVEDVDFEDDEEEDEDDPTDADFDPASIDTSVGRGKKMLEVLNISNRTSVTWTYDHSEPSIYPTPDPTTLRKSSHFQGPKVLQVTSVRDISKSSIAESASGGSSGKRLLRLKLTDGHSDVIAIEFAHIPSIPDNVAPGTKIRLENRVVMHNGILCLNAKVVIVLGGIVPSLYEEWEMNQKYAGFTRSSLKLSHSDDTGGPPPFEKFQAGAPLRRINQHSRSSDNSMATFKASGPTVIEKGQRSGPSQISGSRPPDLKTGSRDHNVNSGSLTEKTNEKQPASEARPKEVAESVPVQNQAAAQKLLQKMSNYNRNEGHSRGWKQRGRGKDDDDSAVLTLDEWERKRAGGSSLIQETPKVNQDEDLARQLQNQFDLEDFHEQRGPHVTEADDIRMSMFSFERDDPGAHGRGEFRGRGRGRGRRRGRGRGRAA